MALEAELCTTKVMTSLILAHTQLTEHSGPVLGRLIEFVPKLAHLDASWNQLGPLTAEALAGGLAPGGHLVSLEVSWNGLEGGAGLIAAALQKGGGAPLRLLNLSGTRLTDEVSRLNTVSTQDQLSSVAYQMQNNIVTIFCDINVIKQ